MYAVLIFVFRIIFSEARVFCQDSNAMPWKPLGYSCPITCSTIMTAIDRLKLSDYQYLLNERIRKKINMTETDVYTIGQQLQENVVFNRKSNSLHPETRKHLKLFHTYHRLLSNENFIESLIMEAKTMTAELNKTCSNMATKEFYKKVVNLKCTRKLNKKPDVVEKFTRFLNRFADTKYQFDEELAGLVLQKLEGSLTLRFGIVDFKRILGYLRKALRYHKSRSKGDQVVRLQSKDCMTIYVPGCYCKLGFVERDLQCVKPEDCITNSMFAEYLERIILY